MATKEQKLQNMILAFANSKHVTNLGLTKLYKLIYFADVRHLREHGRTITGLPYIKLQNGPVPNNVDHTVRTMARNGSVLYETKKLSDSHYIHKIDSGSIKTNSNVFTENEIDSILWSIKKYGKKTATALSEISHEEPAWNYAELNKTMSEELMMYGTKEDPEGL